MTSFSPEILFSTINSALTYGTVVPQTLDWTLKYNFTRDKDGNYVKPSEEGVNILQKLNDKSWEIERPLRASIVKCALCGKHNRDMTYHQKSHSWYCVQCYKRRLS